jgi:subtilisin-like proprotein convertase family protein
MREFCISVVALLFFCFSPTSISSQTFNGTGGLRVPPSGTVGVTTSTATVTGVGVLGGCVAIENVTINLEHTFVGDIGILLIGPGGQVLELSTGNGGGGNNYSITVFSDGASDFITSGFPPYNGNFRPEGRQTNVNNPYSNANPLGTHTFASTYNGTNANGNWTLYINDYVAADIGTLFDWSITFSAGGTLTADAGPDQTICPGQSATLTANGIPSATNYQWSTGSNSQTITVTPSVSTTYTVTVTNGSCTSTDQVRVNVSGGSLTVNAGADRTICEGQSTTLTATGTAGVTYEWSDGQTGPSISVSPTTNTPYTVTASNAAGCTVTDQVIVNVTPAPIANAGPDQNICSGQSRTLTATGGGAPSTYTWSTGQTGPGITVTPTTTTTYTVTVSFGAGCSSTDEVEVAVETRPTVDAGVDQTVCGGVSVALTATGGPGNFAWSTGDTDPSISVSPTVTTTYSVTVTSPSGTCTATDNVRVIISPAPVANAGTDKNICEGGSTGLTASGGTTYLWDTGQNGPNINVAPTVTTTYTVTVSNAGGCTDEDEVTVNVTPNPVADAGPDINICRGESTTLTASGGSTYSWNTGQPGATITVIPVTTTIYTVRAFVGTCQSTDEVIVTVFPRPTVSIGPNRTICEGQSVNLTATGSIDATYEWSTGDNISSISVSPSSTTVYVVTATNADGCTATATATVNVNTLAASITPDVQICGGQIASLTASGGGTYRWNTNANGAGISVNPTVTTTYTVTVTQGVCTATLSTTVEVLPAPIANAGPDQTQCAGETINLSASGGTDYNWSTGDPNSDISVNPTTTTTYTVTVSNGSCSSIDRVVVNIRPAPTVNAGPSGSVCEGQNVTLTATVTGGSGNTLQWSTGATTSSITVTPFGSTSYQVTVTSAGGCTAETDVAVLVNPVPVANAGADVTPCAGTTTTLRATGGASYAWSSGQTTANITVSPTTPTTYTVTVTQDGCSSTDVVIVNARPLPTVTITPASTVCVGVTQTLLASGGTAYIWNTGSSTASIDVSPATSTTYTVTVSGNNGCTTTAASTVNVAPTPVAAISGDLTLCTGQAGSISATGVGTYAWNTGETQATLNIAPTAATTYTVTVTANGCSSVATAIVAVLPAPTANAGPDQSVCFGQSTTLTASGGAAFAWNTGQSTGSFSISPTSTTTYTVTISNGNCSDTDDITVEVRPSPALSINPDITLCTGENAALTATGTGTGLQYAWSNGNTGNTLSVSPATTTLYTATVTNSVNCTATATTNVIVTPLPVANAGADRGICVGNAIALTATGGTTYLWSNGGTTADISPSPTVNTTYTVTVTANGCSATDVVSVTVNNLPVPTISRDTAVCAGQFVALNAGGGTSYVWNNGNTTSSFIVNPTTNTTFSVTVSNAAACTNTAQVSVTITPTPVAAAGPDQTICVGENAALAASGGNTYQWSTGETTASFTVTPAATTTYNVTVTANGCSSTDALTVNVNPLPVANAGPNAAIATGQSATLTATGGGTYAWNTGQNEASISVQPSVTTTYTLTVTLNGCIATDEVTVFVNEPPSVDLGPDKIICIGESVTLVSAASVPPGTTFIWSNGATTANITVSPNNTTDYSVELSSNNLSTRDTIRVSVNEKPIGTPVIQGQAVVCQGTSEIYSIANVNGATSYRWTVPPGAIIVSGQGSTQIEIDWQQSAPGSIQVTAVNDCGESQASLLPVTINQPPNLLNDIAGDAAPCASRTLPYTISGQGLIDAYEWTVTGGTLTVGQGTNAIRVDWNNSTGGRICVLANNICGGSATKCLDVATIPAPVADAGLPVAICGTEATLTGAGAGNWNLLSGPGTANLSNATDPVTNVSVSSTGAYTFIRTATQGGCTDTDTVAAVFNAFPQWAGVSANCNNTNTAFSVTLQISGGTQPYSVNGTPIAGNTFVSGVFTAGSSYSFSLTDGAGCAGPVLTDSFACNCTSAAGNMDLTPVRACVGDTLRATYLGGENLDGDDIVVFVLHTGQVPSGILAINTTPVFAYQNTWAPGGTYFISALVSSKTADGIPNLTDQCLDFSAGTPIEISARPTGAISGATTLCAGQCADILFNFTGTGPFLLVYSDGNTQRTINSNTAVFTENICPGNTTTYQLVRVNDALCTADATGNVTVMVQTPPSARVQPTDRVCNSNISGFPTTRDFSAYVLGGDQNGTWRAVGNSGASGTLPILDFAGVATGQYTFEYTTASATAPCNDSTYVLRINVSDFCLCPPLNIQTPSALCSAGSSTLSLATLVSSETSSGTWTLVSTPSGASANILSNNQFNPQNAPAGTYRLAYTLLAPAPGTCPGSDTINVVVNAPVEAGRPKPELTLCASQSDIINLPERLEQAGAGGVWTSLDNLPASAFNPTLAQFNPAGSNPGLYRFRYTVPGNGGCSADSAVVNVRIQPLPIAIAGPDVTLTCSNASASVGGAGSSGFTYQWSNGASTAQISISQPGAYILTIQNTTTGCTNQDTVVVARDADFPAVNIATNARILTCTQTSLNLQGQTALATATLNWTKEGTPVGNTAILTVQTPGCYIFQATNPANGCRDTAQVCITESKTVPTLNPVAANTINCTQRTTTINAGASIDNATYNWQTSNGNIRGGTDTASIVATTSGTYTVFITNNTNGCTAQSSVAVTADTIAPIAKATASGTLGCNSASVSISANGSSQGANIAYSWATADGTPLSGNPISAVVTVAQKGLFVLKVRNLENGCSAEDTAQVVQNGGMPVAVRSALTPPACAGDCSAVVEVNLPTGVLVSFNNGAFGTKTRFDQLCADRFSLRTQDAFGCEWDTTLTIVAPALFVVQAGPDVTLQLGDSLRLEATATQPLRSIRWTGGVDTSACLSPCTRPLLRPLTNTKVSVRAVSINGCVAEDDLLVRVEKKSDIFIPNSFSPQSSTNNVFMVSTGSGIAQIESMAVYNRWGEMVFQRFDPQINNPEDGWNGQHQGKDLNPGVFVYMIKVKYVDGSSELFSGDITLIR